MSMTNEELAKAIDVAQQHYNSIATANWVGRGDAGKHLNKLRGIQQSRAASAPDHCPHGDDYDECPDCRH